MFKATSFSRFVSSLNFFCINLKQQVEKTQKSAKAGCLKHLSSLNFFLSKIKWLSSGSFDIYCHDEFWKIVLERVLSDVRDKLDPLQFAYRRGRSTEDALLYMLHRFYSHLDQPKRYTLVMFIDFSSAFNTIRPHILMKDCLSWVWIVDSLVGLSVFWLVEYSVLG